MTLKERLDKNVSFYLQSRKTTAEKIKYEKANEDAEALWKNICRFCFESADEDILAQGMTVEVEIIDIQTYKVSLKPRIQNDMIFRRPLY